MKRPNPLRHGWLIIPGVQPLGDRTVASQLKGLELAIAECAGKSTLDLGCAEGAISLEFAKAGASRVLGIDNIADHLEVARWICKDWPNVTFLRAHLKDYAEANPVPEQFDIVIACGIIQKLHEPEIAARFAARSCKDLLLVRAPGGVWNGIIPSKFRKRNFVDLFAVMKEEGFVSERLIKGDHNEAVEYWRRVSS